MLTGPNRGYEAISSGLLRADAQAAAEASFMTTKTRRDYAEEIYTALRTGENVEAFTSKHSSWASVLKAAIDHTRQDTVTRENWVESIAAAMLSLGIEWTPGSHRGKLTSRRVVKLMGSVVPSRRIMLARPGSLKRAALEAAAEYEASQSMGLKRTRRRRIDFGCKIPFEKVPELVQTGFDELRRGSARRDPRVLSHYRAAICCLESCLGDPRCDVLLMLALTVGASSATPQVLETEDSFSVATKRKEPALLVANLVTKMLWFLRPEAFPWTEDRGQVLRVPEMIKKTGED